MLEGSAPSPENKEVNSAVTGTRILNPLRSSTPFNCRLDDEVICRKPLSQIFFIGTIPALPMASRTTSPSAPSIAAQTWSYDRNANPTLGRPDNGTSVDSVMLGAASNSMPPARSCDSISGSPPSWLLGKTVTFNRPDDCAPIARAASINRTVRGWVSGVLTPSLNSNSAAALAGLPRMVVAQAAETAPSKPLRVIFIFLLPRARYRA